MWDLFISHASEDKERLVRPLAKLLEKSGVKVWYDEFSLSLGDSLTESIDKGLLESKYGLIVISKAFFEKNWTDYELKSLLTKEIRGTKVILPVWHDVTPDFVASKSLYLADKKAITSDSGIEKLAFEIIKVVRPDIINSHLLKRAFRNVAGETVQKKMSELHVIEGVRHKTLPLHLVVATDVFSSLFPFNSYNEMLKDFARDADYDKEFVVWATISCAYLDVMREFGLSFSDEKSKELFQYLLMISLEMYEACENMDLDHAIKKSLHEAYLLHLNKLYPLLQK